MLESGFRVCWDQGFYNHVSLEVGTWCCKPLCLPSTHLPVSNSLGVMQDIMPDVHVLYVVPYISPIYLDYLDGIIQ